MAFYSLHMAECNTIPHEPVAGLLQLAQSADAARHACIKHLGSALALPPFTTTSEMSSQHTKYDNKSRKEINGLTLDPTELPAHLLRAAYLVGKIPFRACLSDQRVSYTLYIPEQYCKVHKALRNKHLDDLPPRLPLVVNIHSTRRDAVACRDSLIDFADEHGVAVLAPMFPAALDGVFNLDSYKVLRTKKIQADLVLIDILNEISHMWSGICTDPIVLMGFSGGAQFVHRFMYLYPERISAVAIAAPGSVTKLSPEPWPQGTENIGEVFAEQDIYLDVVQQIQDICLFVGERDDEEARGPEAELREWLSKRLGDASALLGGASKSQTKSRPESRLELLQQLQDNWFQKGIDCELEIVPDAGHNYTALVPAMIEWLEGCEAIRHPNP